jgi:hypothetical protein
MRWFGPRLRRSQERRNVAYERTLASFDKVLDDSSEGGTNEDWERFDEGAST